MRPPLYFEGIRRDAARRWDQLDSDPDLAGPWRQLFMQVQSPRHVLSELLQNADDACARNAWAAVEDGEFVFEHDGEDFSESNFASLCKFGYSEKRHLHTIGFRGVGFKSTFSLGDEVRLATPTLSVVFHRARFTEPVWSDRDFPPLITQVRVPIKNEALLRELDRNLGEWGSSPQSLLFFRSIQSLSIQGKALRRQCLGPGPVPNSEWVRTIEEGEEVCLLISSPPDAFPEEALREIREERLVRDDFDLPPCRVDLVVGLKGPQRLFVVLPTGVETELPFICNAPFLQDPARIAIRDPVISPTNRWLLERAGRQAAEAMLLWLGRDDLPPAGRCRAYMLFPDVDRSNESLSGKCGRICEEAFGEGIEGEAVVLTENGTLVGRDESISPPCELYDIWRPEQISGLLDPAKELPLPHRALEREYRRKLVKWRIIEELDKSALCDALELQNPPKPETWRQLLVLWSFVSAEVPRMVQRGYKWCRREFRLAPVRGSNVLHSAAAVVRLGDKKLLQSDQDWDFISPHLRVLDHNWPRFLAEQRRISEEIPDPELREQIGSAYSVLQHLKLDEATDVGVVYKRVSDGFFAQGEPSLSECIRLAQIAAALRAPVPTSFRFVTRDGRRRSADEAVIADLAGDLRRFLAPEWYESQVLHSAYGCSFGSCTRDEWWRWVRSERSRLHIFIPFKKTRKSLYGRSRIREVLIERGVSERIEFPYQTNRFVVNDWDFDEMYWRYWDQLAREDRDFWGKLLHRLLNLPSSQLEKVEAAQVSQESQKGNEKTITDSDLAPAWIIRFRALSCLPDTRGVYREPAELLCRTPETEALLEIEPFVHAEYDVERNRPLLIKLGVRDTPTGSERLLDRLRALAKVEEPPTYELDKWYHRLDQLFEKCSTEEREEIRRAFQIEPLIRTDSGDWVRADEVYVTAGDEDVPGVPTVRPSVRDLALWPRVGVADRPTVDRVLAWLGGLETGVRLEGPQLQRVKSLLPRHPRRIWFDCGCWLNLAGGWARIADLRYKMTMESLTTWANLFPRVKDRTADFRGLSADLCAEEPFSRLASLASCIEDRIGDDFEEAAHSQERPWAKELGRTLARAVFDDEELTGRIRKHARRLAETAWRPVANLEVTPYLDGVPAGTPRRVPALWRERVLYVENGKAGSHFRAVTEEIAKPFDHPNITDAVRFCFERSIKSVTEYLEEHFELSGLEPEVGADRCDPLGEESVPAAGPEAEVSESGSEQAGEGPSVATRGPAGTDSIDASAEEAAGGEAGSGEVREERQRRHRPPKSPFIEVYASYRGFKRDGDREEFRGPGGTILRRGGVLFPWEEYSSEGVRIQSYWLDDHCLERRPLDIDAARWTLCQSEPGLYTIVLADQEGRPREFSGMQLKEMVASGRLKLHPAQYRMALEVV